MAEADGKIESFIDSLKTFAPLDLGLVKLKEKDARVWCTRARKYPRATVKPAPDCRD